MIIGIGNDLTEIDRVKKIIDSDIADRFIERILTSAEQELAKTRKNRLTEFVAGRFAAKEAVAKALGCGIGKKLSFQDINILPDMQGKPICTVSDKALDQCEISRKAQIHLSISHTAAVASAFAVLELI